MIKLDIKERLKGQKVANFYFLNCFLICIFSYYLIFLNRIENY